VLADQSGSTRHSGGRRLIVNHLNTNQNIYHHHSHLLVRSSGNTACSVKRLQSDRSVPGQVKITFLEYINEILAAFDTAEPKGGGTKTSAAPDSLLKVDED
jgi:hypothetical protein